MKKIILFALTFVMLCSCFAVVCTAETAEDGIAFEQTLLYAVDEPLLKEPVTVEAVIYFDKGTNFGGDHGAFFGNYHWDETSNTIDFGIGKNGVPKIRIRDDKNVYQYAFGEVNIANDVTTHVTLVRDTAAKEARCYINGELAQTVPMTETVNPLSLRDYKIGGNMAYLNPDYFKGAVKSLAVFSDIRTESEIKADMNKVGTNDLLIHYDFTGLGSSLPVEVEDLSSNKNNALRNRMLIDEPLNPAKNYAYSFAVLGDTQSMALNYPDHFNDMYNWIYDNIEAKNIEVVLGLGDITDTKSGDNTENEWKVALEGHKIIDDYVTNIPITGDHDSPFWYSKTIGQLNYAKFANRYNNGFRNGYVEKDIGGVPYLFIQFEKGPNDGILEWAGRVVEAHPNHNVVITTHAYLHHDGTTLGNGDPHLSGMSNLGDDMWDEFVSQYENIVLVLCGHIGSDYVVVNQRQGVYGNTVTEILMDFQTVDNAAAKYRISKNGLGVVNMFYFSEDGKTLTIETYSTVLEKYFMELNQLTVQLDTANDVKYVKPAKAPIPSRESGTAEIKMAVGQMTGYVNGTATTLDAAPVIRNSRTMLPARFVAENLGATVGWDGATSTVTVKSADTTIEIVIGKTSAKVNGTAVTLDSPAFIENSRTYLPVRFVSENLGANVAWDAATSTVTITK